MNKEKTIKKTIKKFFEEMGIGEEPENLKIEQEKVIFELETTEPEIFIGKGGQILRDMERLLAKILSKAIGERVFVDFDINHYKKKKIEYLKEVTRESIDEVLLTKKEKILPPMNSFERRIIHLELSDRQGIIAESQGEEPDRKIIIKPKIK